jgi:hypothetical protein
MLMAISLIDLAYMSFVLFTTGARGMGCVEQRHDNSHGYRHDNSHGHKNEYLGAPPLIEVNPHLSSY